MIGFRRGRLRIGALAAGERAHGSALKRASHLAPLSLTLLISVAGLVAVPKSGHGQVENLEIRLPNPDGRDPVFDQSRLSEPLLIEFSDLSTSAELSLADSSGKLRLINFWATWCTPCIKELPSLARVSEQRARHAFQVIPISLDRADPGVVSDFISELAISSLDWFIDPSRQSGQTAGVFVLPTTIIVDGEGGELGRVVGSVDWESAEASSLLDSLLDQTSP